MKLTSDRARQMYRRFGWAFAASLVILIVSGFASMLLIGEHAVATSRVIDFAPFLAVTSLFTSFVTFIGFLISNTIAWRKEQRERTQSELEIEKKQLEIEKLRRDLTAAQPVASAEAKNEA
jgi:formate hydrogenlyase subunit 3/multisubunit Na+/H+ antiporter MnhD subunit